MTIAFDAATNGTGSFTHTPSGTPRGVLVLIRMQNATDMVTGVTYGGSAMAEVNLSPLVASGSEGGTCYGYFLGSSVPTGAQTVATTVGAGTPRVTCITYTAAADTEVVNTDTIDVAGGSGSVSDTLALSGRTCAVAEAIWSATGGVVDLTPFSNWTSRQETDEGSETNACYSYDIVSNSDVTFGFTAGAAADTAVLAVAISEVEAGGDGRTGTMAATESGADDATASGEVDVSGTLVSVETGSDDATMSGEVDVQADLDATETGSDTFAATGTTGSGRIGSMAAQEAGADDATLAGEVTVSGALAATETGSDTFAGSGPLPDRTERPTGGWAAYWEGRARDEMRRRRAREREELDLTESEQRRIDRAAAKIARKVAKEGLNADRPSVMAAPSFDALLVALQPTEGQVLALADAIVQRILWMAEAEQADEEAALMALLAEL